MKVAAMTATTHNPFDESHAGELLEGKPPEQFLWGGAGNGLRSCSVPRQSLTRQRQADALVACGRLRAQGGRRHHTRVGACRTIAAMRRIGRSMCVKKARYPAQR